MERPVSRYKRWFDKQPPEKQEAVREKGRNSQRKRRGKLSAEERERERQKDLERYHRTRRPSVKSALDLYAKLLARARTDDRLAAVLKRYKYVALGRWRKAAKACLEHRKKMEEGTGLLKEWITLRRKLNMEWQRVMRKKGFVELSTHMLKLVAVEKKKKKEKQQQEGGEGEGELDADEIAGVQKRCDIAKAILKVCRPELLKACDQLRSQLDTGSVHHPRWVKHDDEKIHRAVCRIRYHLVRKPNTTPGAVKLDSIFPELYREFMRIAAEDEPVPETDRQRAAAVTIAVERLLLDVEAMMEEEERRQQEVVSSQEPRDAGNVGIEEMCGEEEENEAEQGEEEATEPNDGVGEAELLQEGEEILLQDPELREAAGPHGAFYAPRVTYVVKCACDPWTHAQARALKTRLLGIADSVCKEDFAPLQDFDKRGGLASLSAGAVCYTGLRSVKARLCSVRAIVNVILLVEDSFGQADSKLDNIIGMDDWNRLPKAVRTIVEAQLGDDENAKRMTEASVQDEYGPRLAAIAKKVAETENKFCQICHRAWEESQLVHKPKYKIDRYLREPRTDKFEQYNVCKTCLKDAAKVEGTQAQRFANPAMPRCARANKVDFEEVPNVLRGLNWIEKDLIQLVKPVRSIKLLNDVGGNRTSMRCVSGNMVLLPVPTEGTMLHVAQTLPSDAGLTILVSPASAGCKLVRLPKVLRALRWLVKHNPHYKDVTINSAFSFSRKSVIFTRAEKGDVPATDAELAGLITDEEDPPSLLRHEDFVPEVVRPMHGIPPSGLAHEQYALLKHPYERQSIDMEFVETKCFPWHWPRGKFITHSDRPEKMKPRAMVKWWLSTKDRRIAQDAQALAFLHGWLEQIDMTRALGIQARLNRGKLYGDAFLKAMNEGMAEIEGSFHSGARNLRGHIAYFDTKKQEVQAHIALFGPATWFVTLNPAERRWEEVLLQYQAVFGAEVTTKNLFEYIARDPYFFARCFQQRIRTVLNKLILGTDEKPGPLGVITHYFFRVEYQHRGTQHVHCMLWAKNAPKEDATDAEKLAYIDRYVTARMPDKQSEPVLYELIRNEQMHYEQHSKTCLRDKKVRGKTTKQCRFDFPRPCTRKTIINKAYDRLYGLPGTRFKKYYLKRRPCDVYVNDYSPPMIMAWKANMDVQYIWSGCGDVVKYVTGYVTKNEKSKEQGEAHRALREAGNSKAGFRALIDCGRLRECGLLEVIDTIMGHDLCWFDTDHTVLNANAPDKRDRMLRPKAEIEAEVAAGIIRRAYKDNHADVYYPGRSDDLKDFSFFNVVTRFDVKEVDNNKKKKKNDDQSDGDDEGERLIGAPATANSRNPDPFELLFDVHNRASPFYDHRRDTTTMHVISGVSSPKLHILRGRPYIPRIFWPHFEENNDEKREDYFRQLCFLFIPWRDENALMGDAESYEARWAAFMEQFEVTQPKAFADIKKIIMQQQALAAADRETIERRKANRAQLDSMRVDEDPEADGPVVFDRVVDEPAHAAAVASMNPGQRELYDEVTAHVAAQDAHSREEKAIIEDATLTPAQQHDALARLGPRPPAMLRVVVGTAGCGKSFVINALADRLTLDYTTPETRASAPAVLLAAPTGLAAIQIRGSTLHSLLAIEVQHGRDAAMREVKPMRLNELRLKFRNARLLIIDELSMISAILLMKSHMRLAAIKDMSRSRRSSTEFPELFGGMNIVLLGDLMQLPPVLAPAIFEKLKPSTANHIFGTMCSELCLFDQFKYSELTINMRQKGDEQFGSLLQRLRVQALTEEDIKLLETRIIERSDNEKPMDAAARKMVELMADPAANPMALFATNDEVKQFNHLVMDLLQLKTVLIVAEDTEPRMKEGAGRGGARAGGRPGAKTTRIYQKNKYTIRKPPGSSRRRRPPPFKRRKGPAAGEEGEEEEQEDEEEDEECQQQDDTNKAGGLEKNLLLAENGRVMLRRNIDAPTGLVNGACGVLKKIVMSTGGGEEEQAIALMVLFDGHTTVTCVDKMSAVFDVNEDEQATRTQFPVVMAFGATVHKAQGLTLSSAIISTANYFAAAPAQGFVALSRVRSLDTLYLVDLHPDKLRCSRPALIKYNELRATVNLPPFAEPVARKPTRAQPPPSTPGGAPTPSRGSSAKLRVPSHGIDETPRASRVPPTSYRPSDAAAAGKARRNLSKETGGDDEAMRPPAAKKKKKTTNSRRGQLDVDAGPWLTLHNDNKRDCYMIAAVNLLHTVDALRNGVLEAAPILEAAGSLTPTMAELVATLKGQRRDVVGLRLAAGLPEEIGDCSAFLTTMLDGFSEVHERTCKTTLAVDRTCTNGHINRNVHPSGVLYQHILNAAALPDGFIEGSIDDIYTTNQVSAATCGVCSAPIASANVRIHPAGSHIIFHINRSTHAGGVMGERPLLISGVNVKRMVILGQRVRMVACVQHLSSNKGDGGHYVVWRRGKENGWSVVDDHEQFGQRQLPDKLCNIHLIVFEVY